MVSTLTTSSIPSPTQADRAIAAATRGRGGWYGALVLTLSRLALAPLVVLGARARVPSIWLAVALAAGFASDVLDGVVARRFGVATSFLRRLDSAVDTVFYLAIAYAAWVGHRAALQPLAVPVLALIGAELLNYIVARVKLGREASYHAWSARLWGLVLFASLLLLFATGDGRLLPFAIVVGYVAQAEVLAITLTLREWRHDVHGILHAASIRKAA